MEKQNVPKKFIIAEISLISASLIYIIIRLLTGKILPDSYIGENILSEIESSLTKLAVLSIPQFIFSLLLIVIPLTALIYSTIKSKRNGDFVVGYTPVISAVILAYGLAWSVFTVVSVYADDSSIIGSFKTLYLIREDEEENDTVTEEFIIFSTEKENSYTSSHRGYAQLRDESYYYLKCSNPDSENKFFPLSRSDYKRLSKVLNTHPNGEYSIIVTYHKKSGVINSYVFKDLTVGRDMEEYLYKKKTSENYTITLDEDLIVTRPAIKANSGICGWQIIRNGEMLKNEKDEKLPYTVSAENYTSINPQYYQYNDLPLILQSGEYEFRLVRAFKKENVLGGEPDYSVYNISNSVKCTIYDADIFKDDPLNIYISGEHFEFQDDLEDITPQIYWTYSVEGKDKVTRTLDDGSKYFTFPQRDTHCTYKLWLSAYSMSEQDYVKISNEIVYDYISPVQQAREDYERRQQEMEQERLEKQRKEQEERQIKQDMLLISNSVIDFLNYKDLNTIYDLLANDAKNFQWLENNAELIWNFFPNNVETYEAEVLLKNGTHGEYASICINNLYDNQGNDFFVDIDYIYSCDDPDKIGLVDVSIFEGTKFQGTQHTGHGLTNLSAASIVE